MEQDSLASSNQQMSDLQELKLHLFPSEVYQKIQQSHPDELYDDIGSRYVNTSVAPLTPSKLQDKNHVFNVSNLNICVQQAHRDLDDIYDEVSSPYVNMPTFAASGPRSAEVTIQDKPTIPVGGGTLMPGIYSGNEKKEIMKVRSSSPTQGREGDGKM